MALFEGKTPAERNKTIAAIVFGGLAILLLGRMFFGSPGTSTTPANANRRQSQRGTPAAPGSAAANLSPEEQIETAPQPIQVNWTTYRGGEPGRNIFAFYTRPAPAPSTGTPVEPTPPLATPTPTPPLVLASLSPQSVYAQTGEFRLQVAGDKFTAATRVYVDGQEVPTQFAGAQQVAATVPPFLITAPGMRQVVVRTSDNVLYSNTATLNVMQPPVPNYTYIGYIGRQRYNNETAVLKDQKSEMLSVQMNDIIGGRFRVTAISARAVELTDKDIKIKHTLPYIESRQAGGPSPRGAIQPPPSSDDVEDEEP